jgi:hypothetical protein
MCCGIECSRFPKEVNRILGPGGAVEVMEDGMLPLLTHFKLRNNQGPDIIFPKLPRWFTSPFRQKARRPVPDLSNENPRDVETPSSKNSRCTPAHDHALLESLYNSVFEHRFINLRPTGRRAFLVCAHGHPEKRAIFSYSPSLFHDVLQPYVLQSLGSLLYAACRSSSTSPEASVELLHQSRWECDTSRFTTFHVPSAFIFIVFLDSFVYCYYFYH